MKIESEIIDYQENKNEIDKWLNIKGEIKYLEFVKILKTNNIDRTWETVSNLYRYDKRLQINLFKYMSFFEEYIRAKLWNSGSFEQYEDLNEKCMGKLIDYLCKNEGLLQNYFNNISKEQLENVRKIRNTISHNDIVIKAQSDGNDYKQLINDFYLALPQEYKSGFKKDINNCAKHLQVPQCFVVNLV